MGYTIDHALTEYYGDCIWKIVDHDYSKLDWKETIKGFHLPDEEMNKSLENFTTQVIN